VPAGTVTHLAPELFTAGTSITPAVDAYAFGILAWELYTGKRVFSGARRRGKWRGAARGEAQSGVVGPGTGA
jgi:hypothetical protein